MNRTYCKFPKTCLLFLLAFPLLFTPVFAVDRTLVLFPFAIYAGHPDMDMRQGLKTMFRSRLSGGGLTVVTDEAFGSYLAANEKNGKITRHRVEEITRKLKAGYAVFGSVTSMGGGASLDLSLLDLTKTPPKAIPVSEAMKEDEFIPKIADVANRFRAIIEGRYVATRGLVGPVGPRADTASGGNLFARLGRPGASGATDEEGGFFRPVRQAAGFAPTGGLSLQMTVMAFDVGDLRGDGNLDLAVLGRKELRIYAKKDNTYRLRDTLKASLGEDFLKVSVGDVDGNGKAEIYLVSRYGIRARSTVYEWDNKFKKLHRMAGHLRAVRKTDGGRPLLLFQDSKVDQFIGGDTWFMDYGKKGGLIKTSRLPGLRDTRFYTLMPVDLNKDGVSKFIGLGDGDRLRVWDSKGTELWRGENGIGGTNNAVRLNKSIRGDLPPRIAFNPRLVFMDINGDGKKELIAVKNIPLVQHVQDFKVYDKSQLIAFNQSGGTLTPGWDTREISYCLVDLQAYAGTLFLAAQKGKSSDLITGSSRIMWFDLR